MRWGIRGGFWIGLGCGVIGLARYAIAGDGSLGPTPLAAVIILTAAPVTCMLLGAMVGVLRPLATKSVWGSLATGALIGGLVVPLLGIPLAIGEPEEFASPAFFVFMIVVGAVLGAGYAGAVRLPVPGRRED